jgi:hypothetical protein
MSPADPAQSRGEVDGVRWLIAFPPSSASAARFFRDVSETQSNELM